MALSWAVDESFERWLMIRRSRKEPHKLAYYLVFTPESPTLAELAGEAATPVPSCCALQTTSGSSRQSPATGQTA